MTKTTLRPGHALRTIRAAAVLALPVVAVAAVVGGMSAPAPAAHCAASAPRGCAVLADGGTGNG